MKMIDFWNAYLVKPMSTLILIGSDMIGGNYVWSIVVLTFIIKILISPLAIKQMKHAKIMNSIRSEIDLVKNNGDFLVSALPLIKN
ncbi:hypothetical protein HW35_02195 [Bacillus sp. X1(2014)]|nr:hypothetical protein HW35_02195 [Bacillus sp. X1(2014)]